MLVEDRPRLLADVVEVDLLGAAIAPLPKNMPGRSSSRGSGARTSSKSSSSSSFGRRSDAPPAHSAPRHAAPTHSAPPAATHAAPPAAVASGGGGGMLSGLAGSVVGGIGSGIGFSVANRAVDAVMGPRKMEMTHTHEGGSASAPMLNSSDKCQGQMEDLSSCFKRHDDTSLCNNYMESLKTCQASM